MNRKMVIYAVSVMLLLQGMAGCINNATPNNQKDPQQETQEVLDPVESELNGPQSGETEEAEPVGDETEVSPAGTESVTGAGNDSEVPEETKEQDETDGVTWKEYNAMSEEEQYAYFLSFSDPAAFFEWQAKAKAADDENSDAIIIGDEDTTIDFSDIVGEEG